MLSWILAALVGAVPLYFGFAFGRTRRGLPLLTGIGILMSLAVLGLMIAGNAGESATLVMSGVALAYIATVGLMGSLAGAVAAFVLDRSAG